MIVQNLDSYRNSQGKIWLNVASSTYVFKEYVNLDNHIFLRTLCLYSLFKKLFPQKYRELHDKLLEARKNALLIRHDCRKPLFFPDNSVDHILCSHFLEHVFPDEMDSIVRDFYRVLKPEGTLHIIVPDLNAIVKLYFVNSSNGQNYAADEFIESTILSRKARGSFKVRLLEFLGGFGLQHYWMYDYSSMSEKLLAIGFSIMRTNETPSKHHRNDDESVHVVVCK